MGVFVRSVLEVVLTGINFNANLINTGKPLRDKSLLNSHCS